MSFVLLACLTVLVPFCAATPSPLHTDLFKRDGMADCNGGTYTGQFSDGQGLYVTSDTVTHPYKFPKIRKCWQDYMSVNSSVWFQPWRKSSGDTYCSGTSICQVAELTGTQTCQTRSESISVSVGSSILDATVSLGYTYQLDNQQCYSASSTTSCTWNDAQCHCVWTQQQMVKSLGYMRKRCNWGNGDETDCMSDWEMDTPTTYTDYGCGSQCSDTNDCGHTDGSPCP